MKCKLCSYQNLQEIRHNGELYYFCPLCEFIFLKEEFIPGPHKERARYEEHDNTHQNEGYVHMFEKFITAVIEPRASEIDSVLEFGCGPGPVLADLLEEKGFTVDKYDPYFFPCKVFTGKKYDLITVTEVYEHLRDPLGITEMLISHLKPGAYLALMTSFHPGPDKFKDWWYKWDPTHICFYSARTFAWLAARFDLELVLLKKRKYCLFKK